MKILHLAAGNRWTGAAAPAFAEVAALRATGVDAHYAFVGGYKLEARIGRLDFTHPIIGKAQNPISFRRALDAIDLLMRHHGFDILHAHLTYDHWLARLAAARTSVRIARTFHASRVLRWDPFTKSLVAGASAIFVINDALRDAAPLRNRGPIFTPPAIDPEQFRPDGPDARRSYGIRDDCKVITSIGKLSKGRGFELVLKTFSHVLHQIPDARLMIIGHGEHRPALEGLARTLGLADLVLWAGYHEDDLAEHYRAADILLFAASGSDEGHRAVLEAMACGTIPVTVPLPGMPALLGELSGALIASDDTPEALASSVIARLTDDTAALRRSVVSRADEFSYPHAARRLITVYNAIL